MEVLFFLWPMAGNSTNVKSNLECTGRFSFIQFKASAVCFTNPLTTGRYVGIMTTKSQALQLCEVEIYSRENLAFGKPTHQISDDHNGFSRLAVDGNSETNYQKGSCTHTYHANKPWWIVDLGQEEPVSEVYIVNRGDVIWAYRLNNFEIRVGSGTSGGGVTNPKCGGPYSVPGGKGLSFFCRPPLYGRYVTIRSLLNDALTLCEVEVYSERRACQIQALGVSSKDAFPDSSFSASSLSGNDVASKGRLYGLGAWSPSSNNNSTDYLQINLQYEFFICSVATQGKSTEDHWTTTYKLHLSLNNVDWITYKENSTDKVFDGNSGRNDIVKHNLKEIARARFIQFQPTSYSTHKALRVEVFGILKPAAPSQAPESFVVSALSSTIVRASWQLPPADSRHGEIKGFKLFYQRKNSAADYPTVLTVEGSSTLSIDITGLWKYTVYEFQVLAFSSAGNGPKSSVQDVRTNEDAPSAPVSLGYTHIMPSRSHGPRINLTWREPAEPNGVIRSYTLSYNHSGGNTQKEISGIDVLSYTVDVLGGIQYQFHVRAVTIKPGADALLTVDIPEYKPSVGPDNVSIAELNDTTYNISWAPLTREKSYSKVILYDVKEELLSRGRRRKRSSSSGRTLKTTATFVVLYDFQICFQVSVRAHTGAGPGPYSNPVELPGASFKPGAPQDFRVTKHGTTQVTLDWKEPTLVSVEGLNYIVKYSGSKPYNQSFIHEGFKQAHRSTTYRVEGLVPGSIYQFEVYGSSVCKDGVHAYLPNDVKTETAAPIAPVVLNLTDVTVSESVAGIYLWPVEQRNGPISAYQVIVLKVVDGAEDLPDDYDSKLKDVNNTNKENLNFYIAAEIPNDPVYEESWKFTIGNNTMHEGFVNKALERGEEYIIFQRALTRDNDRILTGNVSRVAKISVIPEGPPSISEDVSSSSVTCEMETLCTLFCHATSGSPFNYSWTKNDQVPVSDDIKILNNIIVLTPRDAEDYGVYVCHATNSFGSTAHKIAVSEGRKSSDVSIHSAVISLACLLFVSLVIIGLLIWRVRRASPNNGATTTDKADSVGKHDSPRDQHVSEPGLYMDFHSRPSEGQSRAPPEYKSLQRRDKNTEYYNVGFSKGSGRKRDQSHDQRVSEPAAYMELQPRPLEGPSHPHAEYKSLQGRDKNPGCYNVGFNKGNKQGKQEEIYDEIGNAQC